MEAAKHSRIGASSAYRWFECPGSVELSKKFPPQETSIHAAEGTAAHKLAEMCIDKQQAADFFIGQIIKVPGTEFEFEVDEDMANAVNVYLDEINFDDDHPVVMVEVPLNLERLYPDLRGTADGVKIDLTKRRLKVVDYKHGKGIPVEVVGNKQGLYYVLGAIEAVYKHYGADYKMDDPFVFGWMSWFTEVEFVVVQPRARHVDGPIRRWKITADILDRFQDELLAAAKATAEPNARFKAGAHCRFCPALAGCTAHLDMISVQTQADFKPIAEKKAPVFPKAELLSINQLIGVLTYADQISSWLKTVEAHALALMSHGDKIPGFKLVKKKANRRWKNEDEAREQLSLYMSDEEMLTPRELKSPAQIEKSLKKKERDLLKPFIEVPDTGVTIAEESDPRDAIEGGSVTKDFSVLS